MTQHKDILNHLSLPAIAAPMFLVSNPALVVAACKEGVIGSFPALNQRTTEGFEEWLCQIKDALLQAKEESSNGDTAIAPYAVNLIAHKTNHRLKDDLAVCVKHQAPVVITSIGAVPDVISAVQGYGGVLLHDVATVEQAKKAAAAGVDGLILVAAGGGGHSGNLSPFAFVDAVRRFFDGYIVLAGGISNGRSIAAARVLGADLAYLGTRFICTQESMAQQRHKDMIINADIDDVIYTDAFCGAPAMFLKDSITAAGLDPSSLVSRARGDFSKGPKGQEAWVDILGAGQGVGGISDIPGTAQLCQKLKQEYQEALQRI